MSRFHLMHCVPHPRMHGLNGYLEVIESVAWGLRRLGHTCEYALNQFDPQAINIVFGAQVLPEAALAQLPRNSVYYNFEQLRGLPVEDVRPEIRYIATHFAVWEYSSANLEMWEKLGATQVREVPVGYAPILTRIPKPPDQDIDVLMYGLAGEARLDVFNELSNAGLKTVFVSGLYGAARDELIARSKIVLNVHLYYDSRIFEVVRVSYLLANHKAIVSLIDEETAVGVGLQSSVMFARREALLPACEGLLEDDAARARWEEQGFDFFSRIAIEEILEDALE